MAGDEPREEGKPCDVDDVVCQMEVLAHLVGLQKGLGAEKFREKFPELVGIEEKLTPKIKEQEAVLQQSLENCGESQPAAEESPDAEAEPPDEEPGGEPVPA